MFDAHCDTLLKIHRYGGELWDNDYDVNFRKLLTYGKAQQIFAVFNDGELTCSDIGNIIMKCKAEASSCGVASFCVTGKDIDWNTAPISVMVSIEGVGNTSDLTCDDVKSFYDAGVRIMSLTWNNDNPLCGGIGDNACGLTAKGKEIVSVMKSLGMVVDVSHISDKGFFELAEDQSLKMIATHSNSRRVCTHMRNLADEEFVTLISKGGVVGLNTYPPFVSGGSEATVTDLIRHIEHFCSLGGEKHIGLGGDFDGIDIKMKDIDSCEKMQYLFEELAKLNYKDETIRGISHKNFTNFFKNEIL